LATLSYTHQSTEGYDGDFAVNISDSNINVSGKVWSRIGCPGCIVEVLYYIGDSLQYCYYAGIPGPYPGSDVSFSFSATVDINQPHKIAIAAAFSCKEAPSNIQKVIELGTPSAPTGAPPPPMPTIFGIPTEYIIIGIIILIILAIIIFALRR